MVDTGFVLTCVSKRYQKADSRVEIFDGLDLELPAGDFVAIMGPSGSGKTTLLNLLGGIDQVSAGTISFGGEALEEKNETQLGEWRARNIGFVFQFYNLIPVLNAAENVELPLLLTKLNKKERVSRVEAALELVELRGRARHYPREMSGGEQQRVAIARAIVSDPKALLCDEPTGDLDRKTADEILNVLRLLNREMGKTVVMVTHDPVAAKFARRTLHLDKGRFVTADTGM